jgi:hypothetical protein
MVFYIIKPNCIGGVMVSVLTSSAVDSGFEPSLIKPKTIKHDIILSLC